MRGRSNNYSGAGVTDGIIRNTFKSAFGRGNPITGTFGLFQAVSGSLPKGISQLVLMFLHVSSVSLLVS